MAREILSGAEYAEPEESLVERAVDWVLDRLGDAIATLTGGGPGSVIGWAIVLAIGAGAVWLLVRALQVPGVGSTPGADGVRYGTESHREAREWLRESERLASQGDHRGALRCRYQALLAELITAGAVADVPGRTTGEYRAELESMVPGLADVVGDVTATFEDVWYGGAGVDARELDRFTTDCRRIEAAAVPMAHA